MLLSGDLCHSDGVRCAKEKLAKIYVSNLIRWQGQHNARKHQQIDKYRETSKIYIRNLMMLLKSENNWIIVRFYRISIFLFIECFCLRLR